jgi:hypothetical protein
MFFEGFILRMITRIALRRFSSEKYTRQVEDLMLNHII